MVEYELETGRQPTQSVMPDKQQNTFSGYTTSLVTSVTKLVNYFKEVCFQYSYYYLTYTNV